ncbi:MAG TPA: hypothetical protein VFW90_01545 [Candidatus Saccharimonadales bacterium]|nr:hypothetical protein [Candidatus Saccharimonadales bacterium]
MPPTFMELSFDFEKDQRIPEHIEAFPWEQNQEADKYWLKGIDTFEGSDYVVAINIDDIDVAQMLFEARRRHLNRTQPNAGSIQDQVWIMRPGDTIRLRG